MKYLLILVWSVSCYMMTAQPDNPIQDIVPPSPSVAALMTNSQIEVIPQTGAASVNIPLLTARGNYLNLPVSLSYTASGLKVEDVSSWIGYGWSLNAGGSISRTVVGKPDETGYEGGNITIPTLLSPEWMNYAYFGDVVDPLQPAYDPDPDIFNFSFGAYTGEFFFDQAGMIHHSPYQDLDFKVTKGTVNTATAYTEFEVTTPEGIKYVFGKNDADGNPTYEVTTGTTQCFQLGNSTSPNLPTQNVSAWHLTEIIHPYGEKITFKYRASTETYTINTTETEYLNITTGMSCPNINPITCTNSVSVVTRKVKEIQSTRDKLVFTEAARSDLTGGRKLDKVEHFGANNVLIQTCDLHQTDFQTATPTTPEDYRLRLDWVQKIGANTTTIPKHEFEYYPGTFPSRTSKAQDHWGYYNGKTTNTSLIPAMTHGGMSVGSADREPDPTFSKIGMLKRVTYPTLGYTEFEYEGHNYQGTNTTTTIEEEMCAAAFAENGGTTTTSFTIPHSQTVDITMHFTGVITFAPFHNVEILDDQMNVLATYIANDGTNADNTQNATLALNAGNYFVQANSIASSTSFGIVDWVENVQVTSPAEEVTGGVRVSRKYDHDGFDTYNDRVYTYTHDVNGSLISSGYANVIPNYGRTEVRPHGSDGGTFGLTCVTVQQCVYRSYTSVTTTPLFYTSGVNVTYREITESRPSNGKTVYTYRGIADGGINGYPNPPKLSNDWQRRQLLSSTVYTEGGTKIAETVNTYDYLEDGEYGTAPGMTVGLLWTRTGCGTFMPNETTEGIFDHLRYAYESYTRESNVALLTRQVVMRDGIETTTDYTYDQTNYTHIQPLTMKMTNSDGEVYETTYDYTFTYVPTDAPTSTSIRDALLLDNRILPAWRTRQYVGDASPDQIDGSRMQYGQMTSGGSISAPDLYTSGLTIVPREYERYERSWDASGTITTPTWMDLYDITDYQENVVRPSEILVEGWADPMELSWDPKGMLLTQTFIDHTSSYTYDLNTTLPLTHTAVDGTQMTYTYDDLLRLKTEQNCQGATNTYTYSYGSLADRSHVQTSINYPKFGEEETPENIVQKVFVDGLGRTVQTLRVGQAPDPNPAHHIGVSIAYDDQSRPWKQYEPYEYSGTDIYQTPMGTYTETLYESSPLDRPVSVTPPSWHATTYAYGANTGTEVDDLVNTGTYAINTLNKTTITDPDGRISKTFTDRRGRTVLSRSQDNMEMQDNDTYTIYDKKDRPSIIVPPGANLTTTPELLYKYVYHGDDLIESKKVPDRSIEYFFYNDRDLLAYRQDGKMDAQGRHYGLIYDLYGRVIQEGFNTNWSEEPHNSYDDAVVNDVLINNTYGTAGIDIDKLIYTAAEIMLTEEVIHKTMTYDDCGRLKNQTGNSINAISNNAAYKMGYTYDDADNVLTMSDTILNNGIEMHFACRYDYDQIGRQIGEYNKVDNFPEQQISSTAYTVKEQVKTLGLGGPLTAALQQIDYGYLDNRFLSTINDPSSLGTDLFGLELSYDAGATTTQKNGNISAMSWRSTGQTSNQVYNFTYDYLNRLGDATFTGIEAGRYDTDYGYDVRGNLTSIERMGYDGTTMGTIDDLSISVPATGNRITTIGDGSTSPSHKPNGYKSASGDSFGYDVDGNVSYDPGRDADIVYNHLNLPETVGIRNTTDDVRYHYGADGVLYQKDTYISGAFNVARQYVGKFEYEQDVVEQIHIPTGYIELTDNIPAQLDLTGVDPSSETFRAGIINSDRTVQPNLDVEYLAEQKVKMTAGFKTELNTHFLAKVETAPVMGVRYNYVITDHLGNTRVVFTEDGPDAGTEPDVVSESHYYPFGLEMNGEWSNNSSTDYNYRYNGKELQSELGLGYLNYGARFYDPTIGRFIQTDPLSTDFGSQSPYLYAYNNPIAYIDQFGLYGDSYQHDWDNGLDRMSEEERRMEAISNLQWDDLVYANRNDNTSTTGTPTDENTSGGSNPLSMGPSDPIMEALRRSYADSQSGVNSGETTNAIGITVSALQHANSGESYWLGKNMKYYSTSWGGNGASGGRGIALKATLGLRAVGSGLFFTSTAIGTIEFASNPSARSGANLAADTFFGALTTYGGWPGLAVGATYFGIKYSVQAKNGSVPLNAKPLVNKNSGPMKVHPISASKGRMYEP